MIFINPVAKSFEGLHIQSSGKLCHW